MSFLAYGEPVTIARGGVTVLTLFGGVDPKESVIYFDAGADIRQGDLAGFRGLVRRVTDAPEVWRSPFTGWNAGVVAHVEEAPPLLPDLGSLYRHNETIAYDRETNMVVSERDPVWSGPCLVEAAVAGQNVSDVTEQRVGVVAAVVRTGLDLTDVHPDDIFEVTTSRDARLVTRSLIVTAVVNDSNALLRSFSVLDNQG